MATPFRAELMGFDASELLQVWAITEPYQRLVVTLRPALVRGGQVRLGEAPAALRALLQVLTGARRLVQVLRTPLFWHRHRWNTLESVSGTEHVLADAIHFFECSPDTPMNPNLWEVGNVDCEVVTPDILFSQVRGLVERSVPRELCARLSGTHDRPDIASYDGILRHPLHGESATWLSEFDRSSLPKPDPSFPHMRALFSAFPLGRASHASLHTYLLGAFHEHSLRYPRPILMVDSWEQGRGKSEVCQAIARLVDDEDSGTSIPRDLDSQRDEIVAHFLDRRSLYLDNIDGAEEWNSPLLATLSTGDGSVRRKYSRSADKIRGCLLMVNSITGTATFHPDLIDRILRVELPGRAQPLTPQPRHYASDNRHGLLSEILLAHQLAPDEVERPTSRFAHFESAGARAYSVVFRTPVAEVLALLEESHRSARVYAAPAMSSLYAHHSDRFLAPNEDVFDSRVWRAPIPANAPKLTDRHEGASAFGITLTKGKWTQ